MTHPSSRRQTRHFGTLGLALTSLLSPAGKFVATAVAATALVGGLATQRQPMPPSGGQSAAPTPTAPARLAHAGSPSAVLTHIEADGHAMPILLLEDASSNNGRDETGYAANSPPFGLLGGDISSPPANPSRIGWPHAVTPQPRSRPQGTPSPTVSQPEGQPGAGRPASPPGNPPSSPSQGTPPANPFPSAALPAPSPGPQSPAGPGHRVGDNPSHAPDGSGAAAPPGDSKDQPLPDKASRPSDPWENQFPPETDDPISRLLLPIPYSDPLPDETAQDSPAGIPEPSMTGLMLLGLAAMGWAGRRRLAPAQRR